MSAGAASLYGVDFPQGAALKVLVAEDDPFLRMILVKLLTGAVDLRVADNGQEAWRRFHADPPDVLVMDWMMPGLDGLNVCRRVKAEAHFCYVILLSAKDAMDDTVDALECGADAYLVKPVEPRELFARIRAGARIVAAHRKVMDDSRLDALTGLGNRRAFDESLAAEAARADRNGRPFCLVLGDLDGFKAINDRQGHLVGDEVLAAIGRTCAETIRQGDRAYRLGGDEFAVILSDCPEQKGQVCVTRLMEAVSHLRVAPILEPVGMSLGVAAFEPGQSMTVAALVRQADERMYQAKRSVRRLV